MPCGFLCGTCLVRVIVLVVLVVLLVLRCFSRDCFSFLHCFFPFYFFKRNARERNIKMYARRMQEECKEER